MKLKIGKKYKVKTYKIRPSRWNSNGHMDMYMGRVVTVKLISYSGTVYIKQDKGDIIQSWSFKENDFEELCIFNKLDDELFKI